MFLFEAILRKLWMGIPMLKIRRSLDYLAFNMAILIVVIYFKVLLGAIYVSGHRVETGLALFFVTEQKKSAWQLFIRNHCAARWGLKSPASRLFAQLFIRAQIKKTSKLRVTSLCVGNSPVTDWFPAQKASNAENGAIWWRHHKKAGTMFSSTPVAIIMPSYQ